MDGSPLDSSQAPAAGWGATPPLDAAGWISTRGEQRRLDERKLGVAGWLTSSSARRWEARGGERWSTLREGPWLSRHLILVYRRGRERVRCARTHPTSSLCTAPPATALLDIGPPRHVSKKARPGSLRSKMLARRVCAPVRVIFQPLFLALCERKLRLARYKFSSGPAI